MTQDVYLTGITTTGTPHIGNYVGAIRPGIEASKDATTRHFYFLADYHSLAKNEDPDRIVQSTLEIAAAWLALGLDTDRAVFYRQSDIPEILELTWIITCSTAKAKAQLEAAPQINAMVRPVATRFDVPVDEVHRAVAEYLVVDEMWRMYSSALRITGTIRPLPSSSATAIPTLT